MSRCSGRFGAPKRLSNARPSGASCACPGDSEPGPGGLCEGFSSIIDDHGARRFDVRLLIRIYLEGSAMGICRVSMKIQSA